MSKRAGQVADSGGSRRCQLVHRVHTARGTGKKNRRYALGPPKFAPKCFRTLNSVPSLGAGDMPSAVQGS